MGYFKVTVKTETFLNWSLRISTRSLWLPWGYHFLTVGAKAIELMAHGRGSLYDCQRVEESYSQDNLSAKVPSPLWKGGKSPLKAEQPVLGSCAGWAA